jgi:aldose 1-epimerase
VASCDLGPAWPWAARAQSRIELHRGALRWHLSVSTATESFPAQVGWHPWFSDAGRSPALDLHAQAMYRRNAAGLPDGSMVAPGPHPWDDCFVGVSDAPQLTYTDGVVLTIASDCDHWVVYEPDHAVCVEPQSGPPDGFRLAPQLIEPNRPLGRTMLVTWDTP